MKKGFTLIELLIYIAILVTFLVTVVMFMHQLLGARVKHQVISEVEQQGLLISQMIGQTIRNAEAITSPTIGTSANSITIDVLDLAKDPTVFDLNGTTIRINEAGSVAIELNTTKVEASSVTFYNISRVDTPGIIKYEFTLTYDNPENSKEYDYSKTFYGSAALR